jgi:membrane-anchored glycerophosphoryl diester phosphodiesterase (GDPDase)
MILLVVVMLALAIPVGIMLAVGGLDLATLQGSAMPDIPPSVAIWVFLYFLVVLVLAFWVMARLAVVIPAVVGDRLAIGAIARSWRLTRGVALKIVGVLILYAIVSIVANLAATTAFGAVMYLVAGNGEDGISLASVLTTIVGGAISTGFTVLGTAFLAKLYIALIARHEAAARA